MGVTRSLQKYFAEKNSTRPDWVECENCNGIGQITDYWDTEKECPDCSGTGGFEDANCEEN